MTTENRSPRADLLDLAATTGDADVVHFVELYYSEVPDAALAGNRPDDLLGAALAHRYLLGRRRDGEPAVRVFNPTFEIDGWTSQHSVLHAVTTDSPFIVDSMMLAVERCGCSVHRAIHPVIVPASGVAQSLVSLEFDRIAEPERLDDIRAEVHATLAQVTAAVADWQPMVVQAEQVAKELAESSDETDQEAAALLHWLVDDNFIFLGYRCYELTGSAPAPHPDDPPGPPDPVAPDLELRSLPETGLGILRQEPATAPTVVRLADLPAPIGTRAVTLDPLHVTKTNGRSKVHRNARMDYIGIKIIEDGQVYGEHRFLGLFTAASYRRPPSEVPVIRRRVTRAVAASGYASGSYHATELVSAISRYPRDELFQMTAEELLDTTSAIVHLGRRREVAVFARREPFGRFVSCLVLLPRDQLTTTLRRRIEALLMVAFDGIEADYTTEVTESPHAQLHYVISHPPAAGMPDLEELRAAIEAAARNWSDDLRSVLCEAFGDDRGGQLHLRYGSAFGPAYEARYSTRVALSDIRRFEAVDGRALGIELVRTVGAADGRFQLRIHRLDTELRLSEVIPFLHNLGAEVVEEQPHEIRRTDGHTIYLYDFTLDVPVSPDVNLVDLKARLEEALSRAWRGEIENDEFNRLVTVAGLTWAEVRLVQAYAAYFRQTGARYSPSYVSDTMVDNHHITADLVRLFLYRFDPGLGGAERRACCREVMARLDEAIDRVVELDEDRIVRALRDLVLATVRTNYFQQGVTYSTDGSGGSKPYLTLKFDPLRVPDLVPPLPAYETYVFSARTEGVHLRAGAVARGGIRWSTRLEDYRTEVLGLMNTQVAKNAIIVPTGAKGGFIAKDIQPSSDRATVAAEVEACYRLFISGLLDVTDNMVDGVEVHPPGVVAHDRDGAYLVVAADKGTATFSDIANGIARHRGFWLGDAFASGGSAGYDHKAMGITARGAWVSVCRHFRHLGIDVATDRFTVVGIGDMSGDVFGNGMLQSPRIALVGAFDHRHVFIDPEPDPEVGWRERCRLFDLPGSSWDDYDRQLLSPGGAIYARAAKSVVPTPEIRRLLDIDPAVEALTPAELIQHLLRAPVDLLWNGGIGTFIKAASESHLDAADKANDAIRVDADQVRCRVVGEGGNLGLTQRARIDLALAGVRVFTDALDNSAGVATSDIEVNLKILLDGAVADGELTGRQRDELLAAMTDEVAELVLASNYWQGRAVENAEAESFEMLDVHDRLITDLASRGLIDRQIEPFPDTDELAERHRLGRGLTTPELAVLLTQTKNALRFELAASDLADDPFLDPILAAYFPSAVRERFAGRIRRHSLRRELLATLVANRVVNRGGVTMVMRLADETGATWVDVARAHTAAWTLFAMDDVWSAVAELDNVVATPVQITLLLRSRRLVERSTRWLLRRRRHPIDMAAVLHDYGAHISRARSLIDAALLEGRRADAAREVASLVEAGVPEQLAVDSVGHDRLARSLDLIEAARVLERDLVDAAHVWFGLDTRLGLGWIGEAIAQLPRARRWESLARSALQDELSHTHADLATTVLRHVDRAGVPVGEGVADWLAGNTSAARRLDGLRSAISSEEPPGLEPLTVILRELRSLVRT